MTPHIKIIIFKDIIFYEAFVHTTTYYSKHANKDLDELLDAIFFQTITMPNSKPRVLTQQIVHLRQSIFPLHEQSAISHGSQAQPLPQVIHE
jgi:hypothetical protein